MPDTLFPVYFNLTFGCLEGQVMHNIVQINIYLFSIAPPSPLTLTISKIKMLKYDHHLNNKQTGVQRGLVCSALRHGNLPGAVELFSIYSPSNVQSLLVIVSSNHPSTPAIWLKLTWSGKRSFRRSWLGCLQLRLAWVKTEEKKFNVVEHCNSK